MVQAHRLLRSRGFCVLCTLWSVHGCRQGNVIFANNIWTHYLSHVYSESLFMTQLNMIQRQKFDLHPG